MRKLSAIPTLLISLCLVSVSAADDLGLSADAPPPPDVAINELDGIVSNDLGSADANYALGEDSAVTKHHYLCTPSATDCERPENDIKSRSSAIGLVGGSLADDFRMLDAKGTVAYLKEEIGHLGELAGRDGISIQHYITSAAVQLGPELGRKLWKAFLEADSEPAAVTTTPPVAGGLVPPSERSWEGPVAEESGVLVRITQRPQIVTVPTFTYERPPDVETVQGDVDAALRVLSVSELSAQDLFRQIQDIDGRLAPFPEARCYYYNQGVADPKLKRYFKPCSTTHTNSVEFATPAS